MDSSVSNILDVTVPISRFNKGEASKIFDEVRMAGSKVVLKNNAPVCVLLSPEKYRALLDELEDRKIYDLAEERLANDSGKYISHEEMLAKFGIDPVELDDEPLIIGVDIE